MVNAYHNDYENGVNYVLWKCVATVAEGLARSLSDIDIWQEMYHGTDLGDKIVWYTSVIVPSVFIKAHYWINHR